MLIPAKPERHGARSYYYHNFTVDFSHWRSNNCRMSQLLRTRSSSAISQLLRTRSSSAIHVDKQTKNSALLKLIVVVVGRRRVVWRSGGATRAHRPVALSTLLFTYAVDGAGKIDVKWRQHARRPAGGEVRDY